MKPESIKKFDYLYLGAIAVGIVAFLLGYGDTLAQVQQESAAAGFEMGGGLIIFGFLFGLGISLLLWYLTSPKGFVVAKWIIVALFVLGLIGIPEIIGMPFGVVKILNLLSLAMQIGAIWFLFQPDANAWFARDKED